MRPPLIKITVNLAPKAKIALEQATDTNAENQSDAINRALMMYAYLTKLTNDGWEIHLKKDDQVEVVRFL